MSSPSDPSAHAWSDDAMPCAVVDIHSELRFWEKTYARQAFHRPGMAYRHYVPTLKFAYDIYLLSRRRPLQELLPTLPARYEIAVLRGARLDWPLASSVIARVWERLNAPLEEDPPLFDAVIAPALDERAVLAEAMQRRAGGMFTR
jgi:hypothetical protein